MKRFLFGVASGLLAFSMLALLTFLVVMLADPLVEGATLIVFLVGSVWICFRPVLMAKIMAVVMLASFILVVTEHQYLAKWVHTGINDPEFIKYEQEQDRLERLEEQQH